MITALNAKGFDTQLLRTLAIARLGQARNRSLPQQPFRTHFPTPTSSANCDQSANAVSTVGIPQAAPLTPRPPVHAQSALVISAVRGQFDLDELSKDEGAGLRLPRHPSRSKLSGAGVCCKLTEQHVVNALTRCSPFVISKMYAATQEIIPRRSMAALDSVTSPAPSPSPSSLSLPAAETAATTLSRASARKGMAFRSMASSDEGSRDSAFLMSLMAHSLKRPPSPSGAKMNCRARMAELRYARALCNKRRHGAAV